MNERFINGKLHLKIDGYWYIENHKLNAGCIFEVHQDGQWIQLSLESSQGCFYSYPQFNLENNLLARIEVGL
jgi:hypothetical protein